MANQVSMGRNYWVTSLSFLIHHGKKGRKPQKVKKKKIQVMKQRRQGSPKVRWSSYQRTEQWQHCGETKNHLRLQLMAKPPWGSPPPCLVDILPSNKAALPGLQHKGCLSQDKETTARAGFHLGIVTLKPCSPPLLSSIPVCSFSALNWTLKGEFRQEDVKQKLVMQTRHPAGPPAPPERQCCLQDKLAYRANQAEGREDHRA